MFKKFISYITLFALTYSQTVLASGEGLSEHFPEHRGMPRHYQAGPSQKAKERPLRHQVGQLRVQAHKDEEDYYHINFTELPEKEEFSCRILDREKEVGSLSWQNGHAEFKGFATHSFCLHKMPILKGVQIDVGGNFRSDDFLMCSQYLDLVSGGCSDLRKGVDAASVHVQSQSDLRVSGSVDAKILELASKTRVDLEGYIKTQLQAKILADQIENSAVIRVMKGDIVFSAREIHNHAKGKLIGRHNVILGMVEEQSVAIEEKEDNGAGVGTPSERAAEEGEAEKAQMRLEFSQSDKIENEGVIRGIDAVELSTKRYSDRSESKLQSPKGSVRLSGDKHTVSGHLRASQALFLDKLKGLELTDTGKISSALLATTKGTILHEFVNKGTVDTKVSSLVSSQFNNMGSYTAEVSSNFETSKKVTNNGTLNLGGAARIKTKKFENSSNLFSKNFTLEGEKGRNTGKLHTDRFYLAMNEVVNLGEIQVHSDFIAKGGEFNNTKSARIDVNDLYQSSFTSYKDEGETKVAGIAMLNSENARLAGHMNVGKATIISSNTLVVTSQSEMDIASHLSLHAANKLEFSGKIDLRTKKAGRQPKRKLPDHLKRLANRMKHEVLLSSGGDLSVSHMGKVRSEGSSVTYSSRKKFVFKGKSLSGFFKNNKTDIRAVHAELGGKIISYDKLSGQIQDSLDVSGFLSGKSVEMRAKKARVSGKIQSAGKVNFKVDSLFNLLDSGKISAEAVGIFAKNLDVSGEIDDHLSLTLFAEEDLNINQNSTLRGKAASLKGKKVKMAARIVREGDTTAVAKEALSVDGSANINSNSLNLAGKVVDIAGHTRTTEQTNISAERSLHLQEGAQLDAKDMNLHSKDRVTAEAGVSATERLTVFGEGDVEFASSATVSAENIGVKGENIRHSEGSQVEASKSVQESATEEITGSGTVKGNESVRLSAKTMTVADTGRFESEGSMGVDVSETLMNDGVLKTKNGQIWAQNINNNGSMEASENLSIKANEWFWNRGGRVKGKNVHMSAANYGNVRGDVIARENLSIQADWLALNLLGTQSGKNVSIDAGFNFNIFGNTLASEHLRINADYLNCGIGALTYGENITINTAVNLGLGNLTYARNQLTTNALVNANFLSGTFAWRNTDNSLFRFNPFSLTQWGIPSLSTFLPTGGGWWSLNSPLVQGAHAAIMAHGPNTLRAVTNLGMSAARVPGMVTQASNLWNAVSNEGNDSRFRVSSLVQTIATAKDLGMSTFNMARSGRAHMKTFGLNTDTDESKKNGAAGVTPAASNSAKGYTDPSRGGLWGTATRLASQSYNIGKTVLGPSLNGDALYSMDIGSRTWTGSVYRRNIWNYNTGITWANTVTLDTVYGVERGQVFANSWTVNAQDFIYGGQAQVGSLNWNAENLTAETGSSFQSDQARIEASTLTGSLQGTGTDVLRVIANDAHLTQDSHLEGGEVYEEYGTAMIEGSTQATRVARLTAEGDVEFSESSRRTGGSENTVASKGNLKVARGAVIESDGNTLLSAEKDIQLDGQARGKESATVYAGDSLAIGEDGGIEGDVARGIGRDVTNNGAIHGKSEATLLAGEGHAQNNGEVLATGGGESDLTRTDGATAQVAVPTVAEKLTESPQGGLVEAVEENSVASVRGTTATNVGTIRAEDGVAVLTTRELSAKPEEGGDNATEATPGAIRGDATQAGTLEGKSTFTEGNNVALRGKTKAKDLNQMHAKQNMKFANGSQTQAEGDVRATANGNIETEQHAKVSAKNAYFDAKGNLTHKGNVAADEELLLRAREKLDIQTGSKAAARDVVFEGKKVVGDIQDALEHKGQFAGVTSTNSFGVKTGEAVKITRLIHVPYSLAVEAASVTLEAANSKPSELITDTNKIQNGFILVDENMMRRLEGARITVSRDFASPGVHTDGMDKAEAKLLKDMILTLVKNGKSLPAIFDDFQKAGRKLKKNQVYEINLKEGKFKIRTHDKKAASQALKNQKPGLISDKVMRVKATKGDIINRAGTIAGGLYTDLEAWGNILNLGQKHTERHDFSHGKYGVWATYEQGYIGGGTGLDHEYIDQLSGETRHINLGLRMRAGGRITNDFSAIDSIASAYIDAVKGFENLSDTHHYLAHYGVNKKRFKGKKENYVWDAAVARAQVRARKGKLFISVSDGDIYSSSGLFYSRDGTDLYAKNNVRFEDVVTERKEIFVKNNKFGPNRTNTYKNETSHCVLLYDYGNSNIVAKEGMVDMRGAVLQGPGHLKIQGKNINLGCSILNHSIDEYKSYCSIGGFGFSAASKAMNGDIAGATRALLYEDPLLAKVGFLSGASCPTEWLVNGAYAGMEAMESANTLLSAWREGALGDALLSRYGLVDAENGFNPSITFGFGENHLQADWQTVGAGEVTRGSLELIAEDAIRLYNGFSCNIAGRALVRAKDMHMNGAQLISNYSFESMGASITASPTGFVGAGVNYSQMKSYSENWQPSYFNVGELDIEVNNLMLDAATINAGSVTGHISNFYARTRQDYSRSRSFGFSAGFSGDRVSVSAQMSKQESRIARYLSGLYVAGDMGPDFRIDHANLTGAHIQAEGYNNANIGKIDTTQLEDQSKGLNVGVSYSFKRPKKDTPCPADTSRPAKTIFNAPVHLTLAKNTFSAVHNPTIGGSADLAQSYQVNKDNKVNVQFSIPVSINHEQLERFKDNVSWAANKAHAPPPPLNHTQPMLEERVTFENAATFTEPLEDVHVEVPEMGVQPVTEETEHFEGGNFVETLDANDFLPKKYRIIGGALVELPNDTPMGIVEAIGNQPTLFEVAPMDVAGFDKAIQAFPLKESSRSNGEDPLDLLGGAFEGIGIVADKFLPYQWNAAKSRFDQLHLAAKDLGYVVNGIEGPGTWHDNLGNKVSSDIRENPARLLGVAVDHYLVAPWGEPETKLVAGVGKIFTGYAFAKREGFEPLYDCRENHPDYSNARCTLGSFYEGIYERDMEASFERRCYQYEQMKYALENVWGDIKGIPDVVKSLVPTDDVVRAHAKKATSTENVQRLNEILKISEGQSIFDYQVQAAGKLEPILMGH